MEHGGALGGVQTVPRAELRAIEHCLASIRSHAYIKRVTIYSACKMAADGLHKGRQYTSKTQLGKIWTQIWDDYEECVANGIEISVINFKSHEAHINLVPQEL